MSRAVLVLANDAIRAKATVWIAKAPAGSRVEFKGPQRTTDQNSKLWACLTDLSTQLLWHGQRLTPDDYKILMLDGLKREFRAVPNIAGTGFVNLGKSSSDLSKEEMRDLIELILAFGAQHGVIFHAPDITTHHGRDAA